MKTIAARRAARLAAGMALAAALTASLTAAADGPAAAASFARHGGGHRPPARPAPAGNDISWPQCGATFPSGAAFGIVGLNGGLANNLNPCFGLPSPSAYAGSELYWAATATAGTGPQPKASLYVNTGDPGNTVADWPATGSTPYGTCAGENSRACAWEYGYQRAQQDMSWLSAAATGINSVSPSVQVSADPAHYPWWLDVETANTWQSGAAGQQLNTADLQGMIAALRAAGAGTSTAPIGVYSTSSQWSQITGAPASPAAAGSLYRLPNWVPGARTAAGAAANCGMPSFTGGRVALTQWTAGSTDYDHAC